jgi:hypothetical protein
MELMQFPNKDTTIKKDMYPHSNQKQLPIFHSPLSTIWAFPDGSGYPLQSFLFAHSQKEFSLISLTPMRISLLT